MNITNTYYVRYKTLKQYKKSDMSYVQNYSKHTVSPLHQPMISSSQNCAFRKQIINVCLKKKRLKELG